LNAIRFSHWKFMSTALLAVGVLFSAAAAHAAASAVTSRLEAYLVGPHHQLTPIHGTVHRGQKIEYIAQYRNVSGSAINGLKATLPIPRGLRLVSFTQRFSPRASLDGRHFASLPLVLSERVGGVLHRVKVPLSEYRYLRWNLGHLAPGARQDVFAVLTVGK